MPQIRSDERLQVAAKHRLCVCCLDPGAHIFHHLVRMQHVIAYLLAPLRLHDVTTYSCDVYGTLLLCDDQQLGLQNLQGSLLVASLRPVTRRRRSDRTQPSAG